MIDPNLVRPVRSVRFGTDFPDWLTLCFAVYAHLTLTTSYDTEHVKVVWGTSDPSRPGRSGRSCSVLARSWLGPPGPDPGPVLLGPGAPCGPGPVLVQSRFDPGRSKSVLVCIAVPGAQSCLSRLVPVDGGLIPVLVRSSSGPVPVLARSYSSLVRSGLAKVWYRPWFGPGRSYSALAADFGRFWSVLVGPDHRSSKVCPGRSWVGTSRPCPAPTVPAVLARPGLVLVRSGGRSRPAPGRYRPVRVRNPYGP